LLDDGIRSGGNERGMERLYYYLRYIRWLNTRVSKRKLTGLAVFGSCLNLLLIVATENALFSVIVGFSDGSKECRLVFKKLW
jgi:hypothetical protein